MFEFIPTAYAQGVANTVRNTAIAGKDIAVEQGESGVKALISYVVSNIDNWIAGIAIVIVFWILSKVAAKAVKEMILKEKGEDVEESALILVERITKIVIISIGITVALALNGLNFTAAIGALSLGIGFALKDIIGNFISGVIMLSQDRIKIGDFIKVNEILGTIVSIDTRATILQGIDGTEVVIPNQTMLGETLISYSTNPFRRIELVVGVDYNTDLPMVTSLIKGILDKDKNIVPKPESMVLVEEFGDSSISINIKFWVESTSNWMSVRSNLANKIKHAFDDLNINIPFPIRTLKLDEDDRSFLKTMDSMKKGVVPSEAIIQGDEAIKTAASKTESQKTIPYSPFVEEAVAVEAPAPVELDAQPTEIPVSAEPVMQEVPAQEVPVAEESPVEKELVAASPMPPSQHL